MDDCIDAVERATKRIDVADVAYLKLDIRSEIVGALGSFVDLRRQVVECADAITAGEQFVGEMRADEARAPRDEDRLGARGYVTGVASFASPIPAAARSASALSVRSHVKSSSSRPKWPYAAVFT